MYKNFLEHSLALFAEHLRNETSIYENIYRYQSDRYFSFYNGLRENYKNGNISMISEEDEELLLSDIGKFDLFEGETVPLDLPLMENENKELNKPKRNSDGSSKFYVYVKDPKTGKVKKIKFGAAEGGQKLSVKLNDPKAKKSFAARHKCEDANDKLTARYWSCRLPRFAKSLGLSGSGKWW